MRRLPLLLSAGVLCAALAVAGGLVSRPSPPQRPPGDAAALHRPSSDTAAAGSGSSSSLGAAIAADQRRLREVPTDAPAWARLGALYVEQARLTADPSYYPKADEALHRALDLDPQDSVEAFTGLGALANARHRFTEAKDFARRAVAAQPLHWQAYAVLADALTQLGEDAAATEAVQQLLDHRPGTAAFTRAAYDLEQHGRTDDARAALERALADAYSPADKAFCLHHIAELDLNAGRTRQALSGYQRALATDAEYTPALAGQARAEAALGDTDAAIRDYTTAIRRVPLPQYLLELGELHEALGHPREAQEQYALLRAEQQLAAANGVSDDLTLGQFQADHGDPAQATTLLRAEWQQRHHPLVADALGWALHRNGQDQEALTYADLALGHGWRNALFLYHRGEIERSLGHNKRARDDLTAALATDPQFSPVHAPLAKAALDKLA
ncbi:tetratricopeptide repeat protein [Kitasatospora sp. NPDC002040]|uniref:tetratricopeptide repeat protein n=1 Tax=Kitasatospora sp. NPDC002040 TaxID=3154661 RepID=UPI0033171E01